MTATAVALNSRVQLYARTVEAHLHEFHGFRAETNQPTNGSSAICSNMQWQEWNTKNPCRNKNWKHTSTQSVSQSVTTANCTVSRNFWLYQLFFPYTSFRNTATLNWTKFAISNAIGSLFIQSANNKTFDLHLIFTTFSTFSPQISICFIENSPKKLSSVTVMAEFNRNTKIPFENSQSLLF